MKNRKYPPGDLIAEQTEDGWRVTDSAGGVWWPDEGALAEIQTAEDARRICNNTPMRGRWSQ